MSEIQVTENFRFNNGQTVRTHAGEFMAVQRNAGYAANDGRWVLSQLPELYWSASGELRTRRPGAFVGIFDTPADVIQAIESASLQPVRDRAVGSNWP